MPRAEATVRGPALAALRAVSTSWAAQRLVDACSVAGHPRYIRVNYHGRRVRLGGVATAVAATLGPPPGRATAVLLATGLAGAYDDLWAPATETVADKGLAGHLAAARAGRVSGGAVKVVVIGAIAWWGVGPASMSRLDRLARAVAVAGSANLLNLLDVRPGRAAKVAVLLALPLVHTTAGAAAFGAALAALPGDLAERTMLGDTGANALGAALGLAVATRGRLIVGVVAVVTSALTVVSERVSFSAVIEARPALAWFDQLGRRSP